ncbi:MAG: hypothetical protein ACPGXY_02070 [Alphaproteobacteria bacterium]
MIWEKFIRRRQAMPLPDGHREQDTASRWQTPTLALDCNATEQQEQVLSWPAEITLRAQWRPILMQNYQQVYAQLEEPGRAFEACRFYPQAPIAAIEVTIDQQPKTDYTIAEDWSYTKQFCTQSQALLRLHRRRIAEQKFFVTPPLKPSMAGESRFFLLGHGGSAPEGCAINKIEPVFANISNTGSKTKVEFKTLEVLRRNNVAPPLGGVFGNSRLLYPDTLRDQHMQTLAEDIIAGAVDLTLSDDGVQQVYCSAGYDNEVPSMRQFDITFIPKKEDR